MQIPWLFPDFSQYSFFSLTFNKIPWLFPDFCQVWNFPDFSLTAGHPDMTSLGHNELTTGALAHYMYYLFDTLAMPCVETPGSQIVLRKRP